MPGRLNTDVLKRFDELLVALERCGGPDERAQLISRFASDESVYIEQAEFEFLRARDQVSDEELIARMRAAPDMGGATLVEMMRGSLSEGNAAPADERGEDYRSALSLAALFSLAVAQSVLAILELREGGHVGKVIALAISALAPMGLGAFVGVSWLRDMRKRGEVDVHRSWTDAAFDRSAGQREGGLGLQRVNISASHLWTSDVLMRDALAGMMSPRGACDAAFDSGYFALIGALTADERRAFEHPSDIAIALASLRLGLDATQSAALSRIRYSAKEWPGLPEVVSWAEGVRARARALANK